MLAPRMLAVQVILHVPHVAAAQVVGLLGAHLSAALPDRVLHRAGEDEVEVRGPDGPHEGDGVCDTELEEELDSLEGDVLPRRADGDGGEVRDLGSRVHYELDPLPGAPEVVAARRERAFDSPVAREDAGRPLLYLHYRPPPQPQQREREEEQHPHDREYGEHRVPDEECEAHEIEREAEQ
jgi:hypothetical protein